VRKDRVKFRLKPPKKWPIFFLFEKITKIKQKIKGGDLKILNRKNESKNSTEKESKNKTKGRKEKIFLPFLYYKKKFSFFNLASQINFGLLKRF